MLSWKQLRDIWQNRETLGEQSKHAQLAAFLPAALEIQETPPNPIAKHLGRSLMLLFTIALIWACIGRVDVIASAEGRIIPSARVKQIQPLEKAVVKRILVDEGDMVVEGQELVELDTALTAANKRRLASELDNTRALLAVSRTFLKMLKRSAEEQRKIVREGVFLEGLSSQKIGKQSVYEDLLWQKWREYQSQLSALGSGLDRIRAEYSGAKAVVAKLEQTEPIVSKRAEDLKALKNKGFVAESEYLQLEQERIRQVQDLVTERFQLESLLAGEAEIKQQINALIAQTSAEQLNRVAELQNNIASIEEELGKASDLNAKQTLLSPVAGRVQELAINTIGGVVKEAQQLMIIVPTEEQLEIEAYLPNNDIGFVREGMMAEIKIHTFPFTQYGVIEGKVTSLSDDATLDEKRGLIYRMNIKLARNSINVEGREIRLKPGMAATAEIKTNDRRIIEFLIKPVKQALSESIHER